MNSSGSIRAFRLIVKIYPKNFEYKMSMTCLFLHKS